MNSCFWSFVVCSSVDFSLLFFVFSLRYLYGPHGVATAADAAALRVETVPAQTKPNTVELEVRNTQPTTIADANFIDRVGVVDAASGKRYE